MKKKITFLLTTIFLAVTMLTPITAEAGWATWSKAPSSVAGSWTTQKTKFNCYSAETTATGGHAKAEFRNFGTLQSSFVSSNSRKMLVYLMEYDPQNTDDLVRNYQLSFSGRRIVGVSNSYLYITGNIEAVGDNCAELYIKYKVDKLSGDPSTPSIASGLFEYRVGMV